MLAMVMAVPKSLRRVEIGEPRKKLIRRGGSVEERSWTTMGLQQRRKRFWHPGPKEGEKHVPKLFQHSTK